MYNKSLEMSKLPATLKEAATALTPKKGKGFELVGTYRPASVLNSKTLATQPNPPVTRFIQNRKLFHNVRHPFIILYSYRHPKKDLFIPSLDAEKDFKCVELLHLLTHDSYCQICRL